MSQVYCLMEAVTWSCEGAPDSLCIAERDKDTMNVLLTSRHMITIGKQLDLNGLHKHIKTKIFSYISC